ncbi:DUF1353 domain-containing protein [Litchfieldella anticariensis]|nr:DUF1353 domain-containing protein [Halomonas anticariensis]
MSRWGIFIGDVVTKWVINEGFDREMELVEPFKFQDDNGKIWPAQRHHRINGASIPQIFWSIIPGSPFVGEYRRAAALHDSLYIARFEKDRAGIDRAFYKAMRADNTELITAYVMYAAVRIFGGAAWNNEKIVFMSKVVEQEYREIVTWIRNSGHQLSLEDIESKCGEARTQFDLE